MPKMITRSGTVVDLSKPDPATINIYDIAWSLSRIARFNGHTKGDRIYTVAQHSLLVLANTPEEYASYALMHDAHEAYMGDISRPVRQALLGCEALDFKLQRAIYIAFGLTWPTPAKAAAEVSVADDYALASELTSIMESPRELFDCVPPARKPLTTIFSIWSQQIAYKLFLAEAQRWLKPLQAPANG